MFNLFFYFKNVGRYILFLRYNEINLHYKFIKEIEKVILFFDIKNIIDLNNNSILSYLFFFKYYFGVIPYFSNYKHVFKLNIHYFSFFIEYIFIGNKFYIPLYFFINDIYYMINKMYLSYNIYHNYWEYYITDMNFFLEKKNSIGFYNLKHYLFFQFFLKKDANHIDYFNFFSLFKLYIKYNEH